jgi:hypothetical protein
VIVLLENGDGTFAPGITTSIAGVPVAIGDFNEEGKLLGSQARPVSILAIHVQPPAPLSILDRIPYPIEKMQKRAFFVPKSDK